MLKAIRTLALDFVFEKLGDKNNPPVDLDKWYRNLRITYPDKLFPFLVEGIDNIEKIYILQADTDKDTVKLFVEDMTEEKALRLPFKQYRARAIGPVIKRSKSRDEVSPNMTTQNATLKYFRKVKKSDVPWADYFREISEIIDKPKLKLTDNSVIETGENKKWANIYSAALDLIPTTKGTVMVTVADKDGRWPGDRLEYRNYLIKELPQIKYCTNETPAKSNKICPLCGALGVTVFPNALRGAGINLSNIDRAGAFPSTDTAQAWKGYALCAPCADLLYIYKFYVLKKNIVNKRSPFITYIAGNSAIVIPFTTLDYNARRSMQRKVDDFVKSASFDVEEDELSILDIMKKEKGILNLIFLWATVGQEISDVTGMITNVPPSRLMELSRINEDSHKWKHLLFPETLRVKEGNFSPDLSLRALKVLFFRPGGKKAKDANGSMKLRQLKKSIAASIYHKVEIPATRFWEEIMTTARWHWLGAIQKGSGYNLLYEGKNEKTGEHYLTCAGWIRHLCWWIYYFKRLEVMKMEKNFYEPQMDELKPYFGPESGIDSSEKAYAFLLGVLYGKVLQVQGARGINVGANALTWLKRLTLKGSNLPGLYIKIRERLLVYETEKNSKVRELVTEIGRLGVQLKDKIELDETLTNYYLLLGQSLTTTILPKKEEDKNQIGGK